MTPMNRQRVRRALWASLIPIAWGLLSALDRRFVHADRYEKDRATDSLQTVRQVERGNLKDSIINAKLDDIVFRVQQIQCGKRIVEGCR